MPETYSTVWDSIIDSPVERESFRLKSLLMMNIERHIHEQGLTQQQAADKMGVTQPRISDLVRGKMDRFTIDMLVNMLAALGLHLDVQFRKAT